MLKEIHKLDVISYKIFVEVDMYKLGSIVKWNPAPDLSKSQKKLLTRNPDYMLFISQNADSTCNMFPCWLVDPGDTICIFANPKNLFVDARKIITVKVNDITACGNYTVVNPEGASQRVLNRYREHREIKHLDKMERVARQKKDARERANTKRCKKIEERKERKERKKEIEKTYGEEYELAVINNDRKEMRRIEKEVGYDPRPKLGGGKGSNLKDVRNPKPCVGGRVSPK